MNETKLYCNECGKELRVGEQTDIEECIEYIDRRGGIVCEECDKIMSGFQNVMILPRADQKNSYGGIKNERNTIH